MKVKRKSEKEKLFVVYNKGLKNYRILLSKDRQKGAFIPFVPRNFLQELHKNSKQNNTENLNLRINRLSPLKVTNKVKFSKEYDQILKKIEDETNLLKKDTQCLYQWSELNLKVLDKLVNGLGGHSIFESDITLHHIYGVPGIPAQSIKGVLRGYVIKEYFGGKAEDAVKDPVFQHIFGTGSGQENHSQGRVVFLDSYPLDTFEIEPDVMAVHYDNYYNKNEIPKPGVPLVNKFHVVKNCTFAVHFGIRKDILDDKCSFDHERGIEEFLRKSLTEVAEWVGFGGKTSVGYGYLESVQKS